jgi:hypothetical protein
VGDCNRLRAEGLTGEVSRQMRQVPGSSWSILDEPPTGTSGNVATRTTAVAGVNEDENRGVISA